VRGAGTLEEVFIRTIGEDLTNRRLSWLGEPGAGA
jgi:hypothetical protein